jgi:hypothetical protein
MDERVNFERHASDTAPLAPATRPTTDAPVVVRQVQIERQMHRQPDGNRAQRRPEERREPYQRQCDLRFMRHRAERSITGAGIAAPGRVVTPAVVAHCAQIYIYLLFFILFFVIFLFSL